MLLDHRLALTLREAREGEHADLGGDVRPVTWHAPALNSTSQRGSHIVHPVADNDELVKPLSTHLRVVENCSGNPGTVLWWRRVVAPDDDLNLGEDTLS